MCEQTEVIYLEGDIVWVKLGPCWWPGEVKDFDKMEPDIKRDFKKPPIAVVKFFQEETFEYVKNINSIYKYNCRRKNDFIKKGLDLHRKDNSFMKKFPSDVSKAESLTGGDPEIIKSNVFTPEQKPSYSRLFGTPSPKKTPKYSGRGRPSLSSLKLTPKSAETTPSRILHKRFLGKSDYEVTMLEQTTPSPASSNYSCHICGFESTRLNVIVLHNKSHSSGYITSVNNKKPIKKRGRKAAKATFANTSTIDEDIQLIRQGFLLSASDSSDAEIEEVEKPKSAIKRKTNNNKVTQNKKAKATASTICSNLLADWGDSDAEESEPAPKDEIKNVENIGNKLLAEWDTNSDDENTEIKKREVNVKEKKVESNENGKVELKNSCFDFEEEEEQTVLQKSPGRKIPRVIPQKRKSADMEKDNEEDQKKNNEKEQVKIKEPEKIQEPEVDDSTFINLLEETVVPELPTIDALKTTQNFQERKLIKSPDKKLDENPEKTNGVFKHGKPETSEPETITECPIPKKRFTRNFEDFEMFHNEQKTSEVDSPTTETSSVEVSKLKTQIMTKLNTETSPVQETPKRGRRSNKQNLEIKSPQKEVISAEIAVETPQFSKLIEENSIEPLIEKESIPESQAPETLPIQEKPKRGRRKSKLFEQKEATIEKVEKLVASKTIEETSVEHLVVKESITEITAKPESSTAQEKPKRGRRKSKIVEQKEAMLEDVEIEKSSKSIEDSSVKETIKKIEQIPEILPIQEKPRRGRRKSKLTEKKEAMFEVVETHISSKSNKETMVLKESIAEIIQKPELVEEITSLVLPKEPIISLENKDYTDEKPNENQIQEIHATVEKQSHIETDTLTSLSEQVPEMHQEILEETVNTEENQSFEEEVQPAAEQEKNKDAQEKEPFLEEQQLMEQDPIHEERKLLEEERVLQPNEESHILEQTIPEVTDVPTEHNNIEVNVQDQEKFVHQEPAKKEEESQIQETEENQEQYLQEENKIHESVKHLLAEDAVSQAQKEQDFKQNDQLLVQEEQHLLQEEQHIVHEEKHLVHEEKHLAQEEQHLVQEHLVQEEQLVSEEQHLVQEEQQLVSEEQHLVQEEQLVSEEQHLVQEEQQLVQKEQQLVSEEQHFVQEEQPLVQEEHQLIQEEQPLVQEEQHVVHVEQHLVQEEQHLVQEEKHLVQEEQLLVQEEQHLVQEEHLVQDNQHLVQEDQHLVVEQQQVVQEEPNIVEVEQHVLDEKRITQEVIEEESVENLQSEEYFKKEAQIPEQTEEITQSEENKPKMVVDISDICIDNTDNLSGLTTLAAVSELTGNFVFDSSKQTEQSNENKRSVLEQDTITIEKEEIIEETIIEEHPVVQENVIEDIPKPEDIPLPVTPKKVATLANFSMDFSDSNESLPLKKEELLHEEIPVTSQIEENISETITDVNNFNETIVSENINMSNEIGAAASEFPPFTFMDEENIVHEEYVEKEEQIETPESLESEMAKLTDTHPGSEEVFQETQNTSSSKLLEILTESKTAVQSKKLISGKNVIQGTNSNKLNMVITGDKGMVKKFDSKNSKFVIKSAKTPTKSNKPIILSEKIIKPVTDSETVSVKKVTSKRTYQDVEDIDTFIIQKPKKSNTGDSDMHDIILTPKTELKHIKGSGSRARGKPKIIEQTIIKAADVPSTETGPLLDDSMFDINSMPIVLSDQILTPESIENMPVVMSDYPVQSVASSSTTTTVTEKTQTIASLKRGGTLQQIKLLNKSKVNTSQTEGSPKIQQTLVKNVISRGLSKNQKVYASSTKLLKNNPAVITQPGKPEKFIILPTTTASPSPGSKYTVGKRLAMKTTTALTPSSSKLKAIQGLSNEPSGNKIMIVTNNQGVQSRVLLTPAQQKMLAGKMPATKITKGQSQVKGNIIHPKSILTSKGTLLPLNSGMTTQKSLITQAIMTSKGQLLSPQGQTLVTSEGQVLTPLTPQQLRSIKSDAKGRRIQPNQRILLPEKSLDTTPKGKIVMSGKKTILLKGSPGPTYRKVAPSTPESKTVYMSGQKQLLSISGQQFQQAGVSGKQLVVTSKGHVIKTDKVNIAKAGEKVNIQRVSKTPTRIMKSKSQMIMSPTTTSHKSSLQNTISVPPLAPITAGQAKKSENLLQIVDQPQTKLPVKEIKEKDGAPIEQKHLIIQDNLGNQTTVTEGQILALPRETVDGQPQSYMLVTVDESGNLAPLSNEALMSLEPGLALGGGDMNNLVLQIDQQGAQAENQAIETKTEISSTETITETTSEQQVVSIDGQQMILDQTHHVAEQQIVMSEGQQITESYDDTQVIAPETTTEQQTLACNISTGETSQQLIITGDPESTQKFLASLSEGNTDLSSLLTGAEGNIIINTDGQQILLNTDSENQILLMPPSTEEEINQNAMFVTQQAMKNQDILAAALADTDVFQQDSNGEKLVSQDLVKASNVQCQLSPNSAMYPMSVGNVLETSLTLGTPIMTPLEVPSNKKIKHDIESTIMTQVPSSLELPITITDPSISQTVSQQVMLTNELQSNLELPISVGETITSIQSTEMNSSNFVYSLPSLDDNSEIETKVSFSESSSVITSETMYSSSLTGSMSMPLLTEEPEISQVNTPEDTLAATEEKMTPEVTAVAPVDVESEPQPTTSFSEPLESTNFPSETIQDESVVEMTQKISTTLEISPIEDDLDLQQSDMCDSLSEPPPGMFEKSSFLNDPYLKEPENTNDIPITSEPTNMPDLDENEQKGLENNENIDLAQEQTNIVKVNEELPPSELSEVNSPRLDIDETSCEIPIQPAIVTNLTDSNLSADFETENRKRESDQIDESDSKRTKLSCD